jgi:hypothetical protein
VVVGQQQDAGAEQDAPRAGGDERQALERITVGQRRVQLHRADPRAGVEGDVFRHVQGFEAEVFGISREAHESVRVDAEMGRAVADSELHTGRR